MIWSLWAVKKGPGPTSKAPTCSFASVRNPVLISACMSAAVERDPFDNRWFSKRKAVNRIDPLVALTMAVGGAAMGGSARSVYEERGLLVL